MKERLHTADHILNTILEEKHNAKSTGMTSDENIVSVNLETETDLRTIKDQLEKEVNDIIRKGLDVKMYSLPKDEAKKIVDMRFIPESIKDIIKGDYKETLEEVKSPNDEDFSMAPHLDNVLIVLRY